MAYRHPRPPQQQPPHIALWMLRLVTLPNALRQFVRKGDFGRDDIAYALGLDHWIDPEDRPFNPQAVRAELHQQLGKAQRACAKSPLPALLHANVQRLAALVGLDAVDARILAFAVCLHNEPMLDETAELLDSLTTTQVIKTVAMLLTLPEAQVRTALGSQGLLARSGLVVVDRSGSGRLKSKLELLSHTFADQMVSTDADPVHLLRGKIQPAAPGGAGARRLRPHPAHAEHRAALAAPCAGYATARRQPVRARRPRHGQDRACPRPGAGPGL